MILINFCFKKIKNNFKKLDKKIIKIMQNGLKFCFILLMLSISVLTTYLFFIHNTLIYQIGILIFELSLYLSADFIVSGIAVDTIRKQIL